MKITLEELLAFTAVVDSGSVTAAADRLGQTTSGVSRALSRLEAKLDATLLRRTTRRLSLTEEGQSFLAPAREILRSVDQAEELMALRRRLPAGRLRVNAAAPFMAHVLVPMVAEFRRRYPQIELELDTDDRNIDLLEKRADIAIRIGAARLYATRAPAGQQPVAHSRQPGLPATAWRTARRGRSAPPLPVGIHLSGVAEPVAAASPAGAAFRHRTDDLGLQRGDAA